MTYQAQAGGARPAACAHPFFAHRWTIGVSLQHGKRSSWLYSEFFGRPIPAHGQQLDQRRGVAIAIKTRRGENPTILDVIGEEFRLFHIAMQYDVVPRFQRVRYSRGV